MLMNLVLRFCSGRLLPGLLAATLVSCGGGTTQIEPFEARQVISIGDETVGLLIDGTRVGINALNADSTIDCAQLPIWSQQLTSNFGFPTDRCNAPGAPGITRAAANAKAADIEAQITAQMAASPVTNKDLFVVMVGMHDIIELFEAHVGDRSCDSGARDPPAGSLMAEVDARGRVVAAQISRILAADGRAMVSTVHDLGYTPYALSRGAGSLLTCLTARFNARVRVDIKPLDGRLWGLVLADDTTVALARNPGSFGFSNITDAACNNVPPAPCTTATLVAGAGTGNYLWADDRHFGPQFHNQMASQAITRARNNPF
jgi:hypothetical protein